ncbi:hypothetical protein KAX02_02950 [candidate division WOR-3 bacterium]|nr:hypothetical protein [candidate division WOR-3 bacterium]
MFKGVVVKKSNRNIEFKIVDLKGNVATFVPEDILGLIDELKEAYKNTFLLKKE